MPSLIGQTLINRQLPGKRQILGAAKNLIKDAVKNPVKAFKEGLARDRLANRAYTAATGQTRGQATKAVVSAIGRGAYRGGGKDLLVNTGGLAGSIAGGNVGGKLGSLGGDWLGAAAARKALDHTEAVVAASKIRNNPKFRQQPLAVRTKILAKRARGFARASDKRFGSELKQDTVGWGIGNASADALQAAGSHVPLQGGMTAMATVKPVMRGYGVSRRLAMRGLPLRRSAGAGALVTARGTARGLNPAPKIRRGWTRERRMYNSVNSELQRRLPSVPTGVNFKSSRRLVTFKQGAVYYSY